MAGKTRSVKAVRKAATQKALPQHQAPHQSGVNKQGQKLGAKGHRTRLALMTAARELMRECSPIDLSAVSIAKAANVASASFYMYFKDVRDLLYEMSEIAGQDYETLNAIVDEDWDASTLEIEPALRFVRAFNAVWSKHREVFLFRELEADHGDHRFEELRMRSLTPIIVHLARKIRQADPSRKSISIEDAHAESVVLISAMERIAASDPRLVERQVGRARMERAIASIISRSLGRPF